MLAGGAAGEHKDGDVATADGEKQPDRTEQQSERTTEMMDEVVIQTDNGEPERFLGKILGRLPGELMDERPKCGIGCRMADPWLEANTDGVYISVTGSKIERHVDVGVVPGEA
jgi:hypothetical protein